MQYKINGKLVIVGGHDTWLKIIRQALCGNVKYIDRERDFHFSVLQNADAVWIQPNAMSHKQAHKVMKYAKLYKVPVRYFGFASAQKCVEQIMGGSNA